MDNKEIPTIEKHDYMRPNNVLVTYTADDKMYVEIAGVNEKGKIMAFRPLALKEAITLGNALVDRATKIHIGRIPRELLYLSYNAGQFDLVWYSPIRKVKILFDDNLHIPDGECFVPALIWQYKDSKLRVWAVKDGEAIEDNLQLHKAPFHNIHDSNDVCMGNAMSFVDRSTTSVTQFIREVMQAFFYSKFTTLHQNPVNGNLNTIYKGIMNSGNLFPEEVLKLSKIKLRNLYAEDRRNRSFYSENGQDNVLDQDDDDAEPNEHTWDPPRRS